MPHGKFFPVIGVVVVLLVAMLQAAMLQAAMLQASVAADLRAAPTYDDARSLMVNFLREEFAGNTRYREKNVTWIIGYGGKEGYRYGGGANCGCRSPNSSHYLNWDSSYVVTSWSLVSPAKGSDYQGDRPLEPGAKIDFKVKFSVVGQELFYQIENYDFMIIFAKAQTPYYEYVDYSVTNSSGKLKLLNPAMPRIGLGGAITDVKNQINDYKEQYNGYVESYFPEEMPYTLERIDVLEALLVGLNTVDAILPPPEGILDPALAPLEVIGPKTPPIPTAP